MASGFELLTLGNPKTLKGEKRGYLTFVLHLAPASLSGHNVCPMSTEGCRASCLNKAGRGGIFAPGATDNHIQRARIRRTKWFFERRDDFMRALERDITRAIKHAKRRKLIPVFRLNGTSDIRWERVPVGAHANIMSRFPRVQFYDYTKLANRRDVPANYYLTFSLGEGNAFDAAKALRVGVNIAVVFRSRALVETLLGHPWAPLPLTPSERVHIVIDGDESDLRFRDRRGGHIVALYAKGPAKRDASGFVRDR